ncbi:hypothetical protein Ccrd_014510 [Cynara cardunculus var. scolymus]|uniref:Uncharacterized protein n=1 Tax=Cynara cardunculus var. scolymus TaxID=59895 RepID=A0A103YDK7_CYNCS|nr:hypothetical protein Ccrd_014510 [Cynara cardunculus var. scolymus]
MEPEIKKRKVFRPPPRRATPSTAETKDHAVTTSTIKPTVNVAQTRVAIDPRIQMAKNHAVAQAQQDGSKANFRIFDSPFGNFLVPSKLISCVANSSSQSPAHNVKL